MKYFSLLFLLVTLLTSATVSKAQTPAGEATKQAIMQLENSFNDAMVKADVATLEKILADDWRINLDANLINRSQYLDWLKTNTPYTSIKDREVDVRLHGDSAVVVSGISARGLKGGTATRDLRFTRVYAKSANGWQLVAMHFTRLNQQ